MKRLGIKDTVTRVSSGRVLMVTFGGDGASYALDNGVGVSAKAGAALTAQGDLFDASPAQAAGANVKLQPRGDGLWPEFSQTWGL